MTEVLKPPPQALIVSDTLSTAEGNDIALFTALLRIKNTVGI